MKSGVRPQKLRKYAWQTSIWASICTPVAPSPLISSGHSPRLGGTIFVWGAQAVIWGGTAPKCPPLGAGPDRIPDHKSLKINGNITYLSQKLAKITDYQILG